MICLFDCRNGRLLFSFVLALHVRCWIFHFTNDSLQHKNCYFHGFTFEIIGFFLNIAITCNWFNCHFILIWCSVTNRVSFIIEVICNTSYCGFLGIYLYNKCCPQILFSAVKCFAMIVVILVVDFLILCKINVFSLFCYCVIYNCCHLNFTADIRLLRSCFPSGLPNSHTVSWELSSWFYFCGFNAVCFFYFTSVSCACGVKKAISVDSLRNRHSIVNLKIIKLDSI